MTATKNEVFFGGGVFSGGINLWWGQGFPNRFDLCWGTIWTKWPQTA